MVDNFYTQLQTKVWGFIGRWESSLGKVLGDCASCLDFLPLVSFAYYLGWVSEICSTQKDALQKFIGKLLLFSQTKKSRHFHPALVCACAVIWMECILWVLIALVVGCCMIFPISQCTGWQTEEWKYFITVTWLAGHQKHLCLWVTGSYSRVCALFMAPYVHTYSKENKLYTTIHRASYEVMMNFMTWKLDVHVRLYHVK